MRRAFTLIELLVIIVIIATMISVSVVSVRSGQDAARVRGAARDVFAAIRQARSTALVTQQPAIITFSNATEDGEPVARVEITGVKLLESALDRSKVQTLSGQPLAGAPASADAAADAGGSGGESVEDVLFKPMASDIVRGMRVKVVKGDELPGGDDEAVRKPKISVFSNVDYLLERYKSAKKKEAGQQAQTSSASVPSASASSAAALADAATEEEVHIRWETNGRVEPHQVWVYADGAKPESGLLIRVDRFGAAKVLSGDGREDE